MSDKVSISRIAKIHPKLRTDCSDILIEIQKKGIDIRITQGLRTIAEQDALYAQGRTTPGKKVTNAKGGSSMHNYGLAVDFCLLHKDGSISWSMTEDIDKDGKKDWMEVVEVFKAHGWTWGGDFKSILDTPHFEKSFSKTIKDLQLLLKEGKVDKEGYVII
jgi:peptidoglycan L-alanyl-D-glutamate endopeptidase CwlK